jgi:thiamine-monophosphate kinase
LATEFELIAAIASQLASPTDPAITIGIGDDCAVVGDLVWTIDASVDGIHFCTDWLSLADIGYRSLVAAASDVLAMGATPLAALAAWTLPKDFAQSAIEQLARGQNQACQALSMALIGGNLSAGPCLSLTTTVLGRSASPKLRAGARAGDAIVVAGVLGESALGLRALQAGVRDSITAPMIHAFARPPVLLAESAQLAGDAHAMIDVSDGLCQDVGHVATASGLAAVIEPARLAIRPKALDCARVLGADARALALTGGEDYALVAAVADGVALPEGAYVIGRFEVGEGVWLQTPTGRLAAPTGYDHRA